MQCPSYHIKNKYDQILWSNGIQHTYAMWTMKYISTMRKKKQQRVFKYLFTSSKPFLSNSGLITCKKRLITQFITKQCYKFI